MRVAIVNDLALATETLRRLLLDMPGIQVAWTAVDGREAVEKARRDRPDLILMDMVMPVMGGPEATKQIMAESPCAIVVVTATVGGNAERVYEALSAGALDATETPALGAGWDAAREALARKIDQVRRLRGAMPPPCGPGAEPKRHPVGSGATAPAARASMHPPAPAPPTAGAAATHMPAAPPMPIDRRVVAIGASTGGPAALATILGALPHDFPFAIVAVQHLDASFVPGLVSWLARETGRRVQIAYEGDSPRRSVCAIGGEDRHLVLGPGGRFVLEREPADAIHRPSVDVLFRSLLSAPVEPVAAVLLTGMGRDGAEGLLALRRGGWTTIAQDRATSVVWGMPGAAAKLDAASQTLPLPMIAPQLMQLSARVGRGTD